MHVLTIKAIKTNFTRDCWFVRLLYASDTGPALCFAEVQNLASEFLRKFRNGFQRCFRCSWPAHIWMAPTENPPVVGLHGLDCPVQSYWRCDIRRESKHSSFEMIQVVTNWIQIPERYVPYRFDIWGSSHQVFHVAVMLAAWIHFRGLIQGFHAIRSVPDVCAEP